MSTKAFITLIIVVAIIVFCLIAIVCWMDAQRTERIYSMQRLQEPTKAKKYELCNMEFIQSSMMFFPKYNGNYLYYWHSTGEYELQDHMANAIYSLTEKGAYAILDEFLEQKASNIIKKNNL